MQAYLKLKLGGYDHAILVPVKKATAFLTILNESPVISERYTNGGYVKTLLDPKERERALAIEFVELPTETSLDPLNEWHNLLKRLNDAEAKLEKYDHIIRVSDELNPNPESNDSPF